MNWRNSLGCGVVVMLLAYTAIGVSGCTGGGGLPSQFTFTTPDGGQVTVNANDGAASLAGSTWELRDGAGNAFVDIVFDDKGNLVRFENSTIGEMFLGKTLIFDNRPHDTGIQFVTYTAQMFEFEDSPTQFSFHAVLTASAPVIGTVASGTADADGTLDPTDDSLSGTFDFEFTVPANIQSQFGISDQDLTGSIPFTAFRK